MSDLKGSEIAGHYFKLIEGTENEFLCLACVNQKKYIQDRKKGYTGLVQHVKLCHPDFKTVIMSARASGAIEPFVKKVSSKAMNIYKWLEWLIEDAQPFNFVENKYFIKNTNLEQISRTTLMKYLVMLGRKTELILKALMPLTFGIIIDGWSLGTEHFLGTFATWSDSITGYVHIYLVCCGVQDIDETSDETLAFDAASIGDYISDELKLLGKTFDDIEFICADNTSVNPKLARLISEKCSTVCPLIGCNSHKLNLAINRYLLEYEPLLGKVNSLMKALKTLLNGAKLLKFTELSAITRNCTRWSSTKSMIDRFLELKPFLEADTFGEEVLKLIPSQYDDSIITALSKVFVKVHEVSMLLQTDCRDGTISLAVIREVFDGT